MSLLESPAMQAMAGIRNITIKEKVQPLEAATALLGMEIEMPNKYAILDSDEKDKQVFYATEETECLPMQCTKLSIIHVLHTDSDQPYEAFRMENPSSCPCLCFNRPETSVVDARSGDPLGSITDPCTCLSMKFAIKGPDGEEVGYADGGSCQWGMCCQLPCGPCSVVEFDLQDADSKSVGKLTKKVPGCLKFLFAPDVDNYHVKMEGVEDVRLKALFMSLALFMDVRYFSDNKNDDGASRALPWSEGTKYS
mmetsp:Transcript_74071/g.160163  ORF Transcript_74071/g.160163 Transcript_74071/m.160163 type:complete len:252 (+) Transcript_74071:115-870(+)